MTDDELLRRAKAVAVAVALTPTGSSTPIVDQLTVNGDYELLDRRGRNAGLLMHTMLMEYRHHQTPLTQELLNATRAKTG